MLGLPDVTKANEAYVEKVTNLMNNAGGIDQLQELGKQIAPMGQMGLQLFQQLIQLEMSECTRRRDTRQIRPATKLVLIIFVRVAL